jgi:hypothetical protein
MSDEKNIFINESENKQEESIMKHKLSTTLAVVVLTVALGVSPVKAQTVANGPYYAPPSWDQTLPVATRFIVLANFASAAVLDRETGLVWEKSPVATALIWDSARRQCVARTTGGRKGWRLPSVHELASLVDPSVTGPALPVGHPFLNVQSSLGSGYWSATTEVFHTAVNPNNTNSAWVVGFNTGSIGPGAKDNSANFWCVRGAVNADNY